MKLQTFYRCAVWLPLVVPAIVAVAVHGLGFDPTFEPARLLVQLLLVSLLYGGLPYGVVAAYATWWIDSRPESEIRRMAMVAPLWTIVPWLVLTMYIGVRAMDVAMFAGLLALGSGAIMLLGYAYVALVFLLRRVLYGRVVVASA